METVHCVPSLESLHSVHNKRSSITRFTRVSKVTRPRSPAPRRVRNVQRSSEAGPCGCVQCILLSAHYLDSRYQNTQTKELWYQMYSGHSLFLFTGCGNGPWNVVIGLSRGKVASLAVNVILQAWECCSVLQALSHIPSKEDSCSSDWSDPAILASDWSGPQRSRGQNTGLWLAGAACQAMQWTAYFIFHSQGHHYLSSLS